MNPVESARAVLAQVTDLITVHDVDGLPVLTAPREGDVIAGILFRVGLADEPLALRGITHLVEHLALHHRGYGEAHHNGHTRERTTMFYIHGTLDEAVSFLEGVTAALGNLPWDRTAAEKEILAAEESRRGSNGPWHALRINRHGARGFGAAGYGELGLRRLDRPAIETWVRERFTRGNAVAFLTTDGLPDGLRLTLPDGGRQPSPEITTALAGTPAFIRAGADGVIADAIVTRSYAATVYAEVARMALFRELRTQAALSYGQSVDYEPVGPRLARISFSADAEPKKRAALQGALVEAVLRLARHPVSDADLATAQATINHAYDVPHLGAAMLPAAAEHVVNHAGWQVEHDDQLDAPEVAAAAIRAVTAEEVRAVGQAVWEQALWLVPEAGLLWAGIQPGPQWSERAVEGTRYPHADGDGRVLVVGPEGVTLETPHGVITVRFADVVLMEAPADGARMLIGSDGFRVAIEPTLYPGTEGATVAYIDQRVPASLVVEHPARRPDQIPRPESAVDPRAAGKGRSAHRPRRR